LKRSASTISREIWRISGAKLLRAAQSDAAASARSHRPAYWQAKSIYGRCLACNRPRRANIDTRNIAQEIRQLQQMLEDFGIQTDQLDTLLEQLDLVQQQLDTLNETYAALTGATDIIDMAMGGDLDGLLDQEFGDLLGTIRQIQSTISAASSAMPPLKWKAA